MFIGTFAEAKPENTALQELKAHVVVYLRLKLSQNHVMGIPIHLYLLFTLL